MIVLIDNYDSFTHNVYQLLACYHSDIKIIRNDKSSIASLRTLNPDAIILSPGPGHPVDAGICIELIRTLSGLIPILGICLGHQAIVHAFGGSVIGAGALVHGKASKISHDDRGLFKDLDQPFEAGRYHSLVADPLTMPDCLEVHAHCEPDLVMAVKHKTHDTFGVQFHPESILTPQGHCLVESFLSIAGVESCSQRI